MKLFISYAHRNKKLVRDKLLPLLRNCGHEVWRDEDDLRVGDDWQEELIKAITTADAVVLAISPAWLQSPWCQWEYITAVENEKEIIPVMLGAGTKLPLMHQHLQYANFATLRNNQAAKDKFCDDLKKMAIRVAKDKLKQMNKKKLVEDIEKQIPEERIRQKGSLNWLIYKSKFNFGNQIKGDGNTFVNPSGCIVAILAIVALFVIVAIVSLFLSFMSNSQNGIPTLIPTALPSLTPSLMPTATNIPVPTNTPMPTPTPFPDTGFNVIVAGFGYQQGNQVIDPRTAVPNIKNAVSGINDRVDSSLQELAESSLVDGVVTRNDLGVGYILDVDPLDRERKARSLAETSNADLVIYGVVRKEGIYYIFEPSFYINRAYFEPDLFDRSSLTAEIIIIGGEDIDLDDFQSRLVVVQHFVFGLLHYIEADYEAARAEFALAIAEDERTRQTEEVGPPLLYIYAGNSALRQEDFEAALFYFNTALEMNYTRAYIGRGLSIFAPVRNFRPTYSADLSSEYLPQMEQNLLCGQRPPEPEEEFSLTESPLEGNNQKRVFMAIDCYEAALASIDRSSDMGLRALLGLGEAYEWLARGGGDFWEQSDAFYSEIIAIYEEADVTRQDQLRFWAGHAYGGHATALTYLGGTNDDYAEAVRLYELAISLLCVENYYNKVNEETIQYYQGEVESFRHYLQAQDLTPTCDVNRMGE